MAAFVTFTTFLYQGGRPSRGARARSSWPMLIRGRSRIDDAPWPVKRGGWI